MSSATVSLLVLAASVALFVWNRLPVGRRRHRYRRWRCTSPECSTPPRWCRFGDPVVIFIATLFVVSEGLESSGVTAWAGQMLTERAGTSASRLLIAVMLLAGGAHRLHHPERCGRRAAPGDRRRSPGGRRLPPSKMLMPLAFAASAGALLTLSGSPVNVIVAEASPNAGGPGFGYFEFAIMGLPLVICTTLLALVLGNRLLPDRVSTVAAGRLQRVPRHRRRPLRPRARHLPAPGAQRIRRCGTRQSPISDWHDAITLIGVQDAGGQPATPAMNCSRATCWW